MESRICLVIQEATIEREIELRQAGRHMKKKKTIMMHHELSKSCPCAGRLGSGGGYMNGRANNNLGLGTDFNTCLGP